MMLWMLPSEFIDATKLYRIPAMNSSVSEIDKIVADYLIAVETGDNADLDTLCERHPEHADGIRDYFALRANVLQVFGNEDASAAIQIEGYDILREIGRGAMGVVFEAVQSKLHRQVAIKVLKEGALGSAATKKRFEDEAKLIAKLDHEHVVGVIDYGVVNGQPYMVMPLVRGKALHKAVQKGPLPHAQVAKLMLQTTSAISAAHQQGIIHRDIKPANILADVDLQSCRISDFGLAAWNEQTQRLTQTGDIIGTAGYIAPEIIRGKSKGDVQSDIYSIGATIYALLTGAPPFRATTPAESILLAMNSDPVPPLSLNPGIAVDLESICLKCMHPSPDRRYETVADVHEDLKRFIDGRPVLARPVSSWESFVRWAKRNQRLAASLAAIALLAFCLTGISTYSTFSIIRKNEDLRLALVKQEQLTIKSNQSLSTSIKAIDQFFSKLGSSRMLSDTPATIELRKEFFDEGIEYLEQFLEENRDNPELQFEVGRAMLQLSTMNQRLRHDEGWKKYANDALPVLEKAYLSDSESLYKAHEYAQALMHAAQSNLRSQGLEAVTPLFEKATEISTSIVEAIEQGSYNNTSDGAVHFASRIVHQRKRFDAGERESATAKANKAMAEFAAYVRPREYNITLLGSAAQFSNWVAILNSKLGNHEEAVLNFQNTCDYARKALAINPNYDEGLTQLFYGLGNLSSNWQKNQTVGNDQIQSAKLEAIRIAKRMVDRHPVNFRYRYNYLEAVNNAGVVIVQFDPKLGKEYLAEAGELLDQQFLLNSRSTSPRKWFELTVLKASHLRGKITAVGDDDPTLKMEMIETLCELNNEIMSINPGQATRVLLADQLDNYVLSFLENDRFEQVFKTCQLAFENWSSADSFDATFELSGKLKKYINAFSNYEDFLNVDWPVSFTDCFRKSFHLVESRLDSFSGNESLHKISKSQDEIVLLLREIGKNSVVETTDDSK